MTDNTCCIESCTEQIFNDYLCEIHHLEAIDNTIKSIKCKNKECRKKSSYGYIYKIPEYCQKHKKINMCDVIHNRCKYFNCKKRPSYNKKDESKALFCKNHKTPDMVNIISKTCAYKECTKLPQFNIRGETKGLYCKEHKDNDMVDVKNKTCAYEGCTKRPSFNDKGETNSLYCKEHKTNDMINVVDIKCVHRNCSKRPNFNNRGETKALYCKEHKKSGMVDIKHKLCFYNGCTKRPTFNKKGETKGLYCAEHKDDDMINVIDKTCAHDGCTKQPTFNKKGETKGLYCAEHKDSDMIDVKNKTCIYIGCTKLPIYNTKGETRRLYCVKHKELGMVDVAHKKCEYENCDTRAYYGIPGNIVSRCTQHKLDGMISFPKKKCKPEDNSICNEIAIFGINKALHCDSHKLVGELNLIERNCQSCHLPSIVDIDGFCKLCHPDSFTNFRLAKQSKVGAFFKCNNLIPFSIDKIIDGGVCIKRRPDYIFDCATHFIVVEVDENQHASYEKECEKIRMIAIFNALALPVWFIRYNPDNYKKENGKKRIEGEKENKRLNTLKEWIEYCWKNNPLNDNVCIYTIYLYFDGWEGIGEKNTLLNSD